MSKREPGTFLKSLSKEELQALLPKLEDTLEATRSHLVLPAKDAISRVKQELQDRRKDG